MICSDWRDGLLYSPLIRESVVAYKSPIRLQSVKDLSKQIVDRYLRYDPETGQFFKIVPIGVKAQNGYVYVNIFGANVLAHRLAWLVTHGYWPEKTVDHINGVRSDNRLSNLREADWSENLCNSRIQDRNISGCKGVTWVKEKKKWVAKIRWRGKETHLGYHSNLDDAVQARKKAEAEIHGKFARVTK